MVYISIFLLYVAVVLSPIIIVVYWFSDKYNSEKLERILKYTFSIPMLILMVIVFFALLAEIGVIS